MTYIYRGRTRLLTEKELTVVTLAADGYTDARIAAKLGITVNSVRARWRHVFEILDAKDRAHAVATAIRRGEIT
jgi:DNA-binding CsgD family transcriptional regulator